MTNTTRIYIDGKLYNVEPGNYTLPELIANTDLPNTTAGIILKTPDLKIGPAQTFQIKGGETFFAEAPVTPQSSNPNAPGYDPKAPPAVPPLGQGGPIQDGPVKVTTTNLADGKAGVPYSTPLHAIGGKAPHTFSVTGALPLGLGLNPTSGVISGTPTVAGSTTFSVVATDSLKVASAPQTLTLVVA
jgi:hypothetical protein